MTFSRERVRRRVLAFGLCFPLGFAMLSTLSAMALGAGDFQISDSALIAFRMAGLISILLAANLLRFSLRPRTPVVARTMTWNWVASTALLVVVGLLSGAMTLGVAIALSASSFLPLMRLDAEVAQAPARIGGLELGRSDVR